MFYEHMSGFGWSGMMVFWFLFIGVIIWLILQNQPKRKSATEIARERYARGEIGKEDFEEIIMQLAGR